jgi:hypothetical protein
MKISKVTFIFGLFIIVSAAFMGQIGRFISEKLGKPYFEILIGILFLLAATGLILYLKRTGLGKIKFPVFLTVFMAGFLFAWHLDILVERMHLLEYGLLGWLAIRDTLRKKKGIVKASIFSALFILGISIVDEAFQWWLPYRVGDTRDVVFNEVGGLWGMSLFLISKVDWRNRIRGGVNQFWRR